MHVACVYTALTYWHTGRKFDVPVYTMRAIDVKALRLLNMPGYTKRVHNLAVSVYDLIPAPTSNWNFSHLQRMRCLRRWMCIGWTLVMIGVFSIFP